MKNFIKKALKKENLIVYLGLLGVYLFSTGVSFAIFRFLEKPQEAPGVPSTAEEEVEKGKFLVDVSGPKTEVCPLNNEKYTKAEKEAWSKRRPLLVMIENHEDARPQSGLSSADVVYEAVAEGGITRFLAVFYCGAQAREVIVGPVRSARTYFLDWASEYGKYPLYAHVGGAHCEPATGEGCLNGAKADALGQIEEYGWGGSEGNDLNQFSIDYPTFWRDYERLGRTVLTEHTMYSTTERLWGVAKSRGWTDKSPEGQDWEEDFRSWKFIEEDSSSKKANNGKIELEFWQNKKEYYVVWQYDSENNSYLRSNDGQSHKDLNNDEQLSVKNVIVQFMRESSANDGYQNNVHLLYGTKGEGEGLVFSNGVVEEIDWSKESRTARTRFFDKKGAEIKLTPGKIWIEILPIGAKVAY